MGEDGSGGEIGNRRGERWGGTGDERDGGGGGSGGGYGGGMVGGCLGGW